MSSNNKMSLKTLEQYSKYAKQLSIIPVKTFKKLENVFIGKKKVRSNILDGLIDEVKEKLDNHFYFKNELSNLGNLAIKPKKSQPKRILEFNLDLFIKESESKYNTKEDSKVFTIGGVRYKRINNSVFRFIGDSKYFQDIRKYGLVWLNKPYEKFLQLLNRINTDKCNEFLTVLHNLSASREISFIEIFNIRTAFENTVPLDFENTEVFHDAKAINFNYISYEIETNLDTNNFIRNTYKTDYVNNNFVPESCFLSVILDNFKESVETYWNRYNKKRYLTYETLFKMIYPNKELQKSHNGMTFNDVVEGFFKPLKIEAYLFDITYNIQAHYKPDTNNKNFNSVIYLLYHNHHIYHLDTNIKRLEQVKNQYFKVKEEELLRTPSVNYVIIHKDVDDKTYYKIENIEGLIGIIKNDEIKGDIEIYYDNDITALYFELYFYEDMNYKANPFMKDNNNILSFRLNNIGNKNISVFSYSEEGISENQEFENVESLKNYEVKKSFVMKQLLTKNYMSSYSHNVEALFYNNPVGGVIGDFEEYKSDSIFCLDFNRYYASILKSLEYIPVINSFDEFISYQGEEIQDYNLYYVKKIGNNISYPMKRFNLCFGMNIRGIQDIEIISVLQMSKLKKNNSSLIMKEIYDDMTLTNDQKKDVFNTLIGKYDRKENKSYYSSISEDQTEVNSFTKLYGGEKFSVVSLVGDTEKTLYFNVLTKKRILNEGFKPLSLLIKDIANYKLFELKTQIESVGLRTYACNTDCVYFEKDIRKLEVFKKKFPNYFDYENKNSFNALGKLKFDEVIRSSNKLLEVKENVDVYIPYIKESINHIELKNEFDDKEIKEHILNTDKLIIKADIAGAGKTFSFLNKENCLIVCPYNALCFDLMNKGENAITLNKLIGLRYDGVNNVEMKSYDVSTIESICFDEIYLYPTNLLEKIKRFMNSHRDIKFYATGDEFQLDPIEDLNIIQTKEYYSNIILGMFPNQITLHENKRCNTDEDRKRMKLITKGIRESKSKEEAVNIVMKHFKKIYKKEDIKTKKNVVGLNKTADWVNEYLHKPKGNDKYYIGLELIGRKSFKNKNCNIKVNYTYTIKKFLDTAIVITDGEEEHIIENDNIEKIFKLNYARTCHSLQGMSVNEGITIFDIHNPFVSVSWIYTAITRATNLNNIYLYCAKESTVDFLKLDETIRSRIKGHIEADQKKEQKELRSLLLSPKGVKGDESPCSLLLSPSLKGVKGDKSPDNYINNDWVKHTLFQTKKCVFCERRFDYNDGESWSIDRLDNNLSHTKDNCRIICRRCNNGKK